MTEHSHTLFVMGIVMILAGPIIMFFGDRRLPVRDGFTLKFAKSRIDDTTLSGRAYRGRFGAAVLFAGVAVLLKAFNVF